MVIGDLVGEGRTAEVFEYGPDRVVKLLRRGFGSASLLLEVEKAKAAVEAGAPAPAVYEIVQMEDRLGVVFARADGRSMLDAVIDGADDVEFFAEQAAVLHDEVLHCRSTDLPDVKDRLAERIGLSGQLTQGERDLATRSLIGLPDDDSLLHGDFHPGNIQLTSDGPVVIDWIDAARGAPAADIARSMWLVSSAALPPGLDARQHLAEMVIRFRTAYFRRVLALRGLNEPDVHAWQLPVLAARLSEGIDHEEAALVSAIRTLLD